MHPFEHHRQVVYRPSRELVEGAVLTGFARRMGAADLEGLRRMAVGAPERFWAAVLDDLDWRFRKRPHAILKMEGLMAWPSWFPGGVTNVWDQVFRPGRSGVALSFEGQDGRGAELTFSQLEEAARRFAGGLSRLGIGKGDRVGLLMPPVPEAVIAFFAISALGAVSVPIFSGYGREAIAARLQDAGACALITVDGYMRRGSQVPILDTALAAAGVSGSVKHLIVAQQLQGAAGLPFGVTAWAQVATAQPVEAAALESDHPLMILYTSGTSGRPKGTVHTHTGFPIKAASDLRLCFDLRAGDALFWYTDMGWMMGPWAILGAGIVGARLVLFDGTPDHPGPDRLWSVVERHRATIFGVAPTAIRALMASGAAPVAAHDLSSLRVLGSTGEPWDPPSWLWYFEHVGKGRLPIINYSGGTEISGGIVSGFVTEPIKPCSFGGPAVGMAAEVVDAEGRPTSCATGELVIRAPWVGMTRGFWRDGARYLDTYWSRFPGTWWHGDLAYVDEDGFWYLLSRSDDTLNVAGKRVGPAEVEAAAAAHPQVRQAAAVGVPDPIKGEALVLFVVLRRGGLKPGIEAEIAQVLAQRLGKALRPAAVHVVGDLPRTRSGKVMRRALRASYLGTDPGDLTTIENPEVLREVAGKGLGRLGATEGPPDASA